VGDVMSMGCNSLIAQGAGIITSIYDFMETTGLNDYYPEKYDNQEIEELLENSNVSKTTENREITEEHEHHGKNKECLIDGHEAEFMKLLDDYPMSIQQISAVSSLPVSRIMTMLTMLELKGLVRQAGPGFYCRT